MLQRTACFLGIPKASLPLVPELMLTHTDTQRNVCFEHESMKNILKHGIIVTLDKSTHCYIFFKQTFHTLFHSMISSVVALAEMCFWFVFPPLVQEGHRSKGNNYMTNCHQFVAQSCTP